jgi:hypothetical protein
VESAQHVVERSPHQLLPLPLWLSFRSAAEESAFVVAVAFVLALVLALAFLSVIPAGNLLLLFRISRGL